MSNEIEEILGEIGLVVMEIEADMSQSYDFETDEDDECWKDVRAATEKIRRWMEARGYDLEAWAGINIDEVPVFSSAKNPGFEP